MATDIKDFASHTVVAGSFIAAQDAGGTGGKVTADEINTLAHTTLTVTGTSTLNDDVTLYDATNDGNPQVRIGAVDAEEVHLQAVYDTGAQTLDYVLFQTDVASATANKGLFRFNVDGTNILDIDDGGIDLDTGMALSIAGTDVLDATTLGSGVVNSSLTSVGTIATGTWQGTTIAVDQGGTGQTSYVNGELLIGNTTGNTLTKATLTGGTGITVTNGTGTITIDADNNGDVVGPASAVDNEVVRFDSTTGKLVQSSGANATTTLSDNADLTLYDATNAGNPEIRLGAADAEELHVQAVYDAAAQTLDYVLFQTDVASVTANKGAYRFNVDGSDICDIDDGGIDLDTGKALSVNGTDVLDATTLGSGVVNSSLTSVGTIATGTWNGTTIAIANGGTGQTTQTAAFDALAPTTTKGDVIVFNGTDNIRLAVGTDTQVLTADSAEASGVKWAAAGGGSPGGSDTEVQYNNGGAFGGMLGFAWDDVANELTITAQATDDTPLRIKAQASSTAALFETQNSTGGVHLEVKESTMLFRRNSADTNEAFEITSNGVFLRAENGSGGTHVNCSGTGNSKQFVCSGGSALAGVTCGNVNGGGAGWLFIYDPDIHANPNSPWSQAISLGVDTNTRDVVLGPTRDASAPTYAGRLRSVTGFGTNIAGSDLKLAVGAGTGSGRSGAIRLERAPAGASGSTVNALVDGYIVPAEKALTDAATSLFEIALADGQMAGGSIRASIRASDGTDHQVRTQTINYSAVNKGGVYTVQTTVDTEAIAASAGTLTATWALVSGTNKVTMQVTPTGSLTETTYDIMYTIENNSRRAITLL